MKIVLGKAILVFAFACSHEAHSAASGFEFYQSEPWPKGLLPIQWHSSMSPRQQELFLKACRDWGAYAQVECVARTNQSAWLLVRSDLSISSSPMGKVRMLAEHTLNIETRGWNNYGTILHEIGHAFGLMHEHQRPDRDQFVSVNDSNVSLPIGSPAYNVSFARILVSEAFTQYDFFSVMHYWAEAFARNPSQPTLIARPPYSKFQNIMGRQRILQRTDRMAMALIYGARPRPAVEVHIESRLEPKLFLDIYGGQRDPGSFVGTWLYHGDAHQKFELKPSGEIVAYGDRCLDALEDDRQSDGYRVTIGLCNGQVTQKWQVTSDGQIIGFNNRCMGIGSRSQSLGTKLDFRACDGRAKQKWRVVPAL